MLLRDALASVLLDWKKLVAMARERFDRAWRDADRGGPSLMEGQTAAENLAYACASTIYFVCGRDAFSKISTTPNGEFHCLLKAVAFGYALNREFKDRVDKDEFSAVRGKMKIFRDKVLKDPSGLDRGGAW